MASDKITYDDKVVYEPIKEEEIEPCESFSYERGEEDGNAD